MRKLLAALMTVSGLIGLSAVLARPWSQAPARPARPSVPSPAKRSGRSRPMPSRCGCCWASATRPWSRGGARSPLRRARCSGSRAIASAGGAVTAPNAWTAHSLVATKKALARKKAAARKALAAPSIVPTGVIVRLKAPAGATLTLTTEQGNAAIRLADLATGKPQHYLDGRVEARLVPTHAPLAFTAGQEDYPAAAGDRKGGAWVAYIDHLPRGPEAMAALTRARRLPALPPHRRRRSGEAPALRRPGCRGHARRHRARP